MAMLDPGQLDEFAERGFLMLPRAVPPDVVTAAAAAIDELIGRNVRERLTDVKRGLRSILDLLAGHSGGSDFHLVALGAEGTKTSATAARRMTSTSTSTPVSRGKTSRGKPTASRQAAGRGAARRKRSA
jgi:hypothetical protein